MKIINVVGARPNFMKMAPLLRELEKHPRVQSRLVHTGQHYDYGMDGKFFEDLDMRPPDVNLGVGSGTHAEQTAKVLLAFERLCLDERPDVVVVVGDVNSTPAAALAAVKLGIPVAHVEAGLRSFDRSMPEEVNRVLVDHLADHLFITEPAARQNLLREGIPPEKIHHVGNIMIDSLVYALERKTDVKERLGLTDYCLVTLHRPSNVDVKEALVKIFDILDAIPIEVVWPLHPRTKKEIERFGLAERLNRYRALEPLGHRDFATLMAGARFVLTDSGGIQEETTYLGIPCLTMRQNTERPITIEQGTNRLVGLNADAVRGAVQEILSGTHTKGAVPELWDGKTAERILRVIGEKFNIIET